MVLGWLASTVHHCCVRCTPVFQIPVRLLTPFVIFNIFPSIQTLHKFTSKEGCKMDFLTYTFYSQSSLLLQTFFSIFPKYPYFSACCSFLAVMFSLLLTFKTFVLLTCTLNPYIFDHSSNFAIIL